MDGCALQDDNMVEVIIKSKISKMLSDNYTLLIIFVIIFVLLIFVLYYFVKQAFTTVKEYNKYLTQSEMNTKNMDDEQTETDDPYKFQDYNKQKFYKNVEDVYNQYNIEKTNYIRSQYGETNDDNIDKRINYKKYDDYQYNSKSTGI